MRPFALKIPSIAMNLIFSLTCFFDSYLNRPFLMTWELLSSKNLWFVVRTTR
uniref:Uncharacterized protein n=1 Tax=Helianthus annuus TaxID=4232 RepID=A0A251VQH1_HELAN